MPTRKLDLWTPPKSGPHPLVIYMHGGFFVQGAKHNMSSQFRQACLNAGWAVATVGFRLAPYPQPGVSFNPGPSRPQQIIDVKRAARYLVSDPQALGFNINPNKVVYAGHSAGGYLGLAAALTPGEHAPSGGEVVPAGVAGFATPVRFNTTPLNGMPSLDGVKSYMGCGWDGSACSLSAGNLDGLLSASSPPIALWTGETDILVPSKHAGWMVDAATAVGYNKLTTHTVAGADHDGVHRFFNQSQLASWLTSLL